MSESADQVIAWAERECLARELDAEVVDVLWFTPFRRREARRIAAEGRRRADGLRAELPEDAVARLARHRLVTAWVALAAGYSTRNAFHPDLAVTRCGLVGAVVERASRPVTTSRHLRGFDTSKIPGFAQCMTHGGAAGVLEAEGVRRLRVAADTSYLVAGGVNRSGHQETVVQHEASGLRALFTVDPVEPLFGSVMSKPYLIDSIDPGNPGPCGYWSMYAGLGIGTGIYRHAGAVLPGVRWRAGALSNYSMAVRRRLHAEDPFRWAGYVCGWCGDRGVVWRSAPRSAFGGHPGV